MAGKLLRGVHDGLPEPERPADESALRKVKQNRAPVAKFGASSAKAPTVPYEAWIPQTGDRFPMPRARGCFDTPAGSCPPQPRHFSRYPWVEQTWHQEGAAEDVEAAAHALRAIGELGHVQGGGRGNEHRAFSL